MQNLTKKLKRLVTDQEFRFHILQNMGVYNLVPDKLYLKRFFRAHMHQKLDWNHLQTFNQKLQWLKLYDRRPEYRRMADKLEAKDYVAERIGREHIIPTIAVWDRIDQIDFDALPDQFVLKCTHDSGGVVICNDKAHFDVLSAKKKLEKSLKRKYFHYGREWPYKGLKPRIMAEQYMCDGAYDKDNLTDYKIFCFDGEPQFVMTVRDRSKGKGQSLHRWYNMDWELQDLDLDYRNEIKEPEPRPQQLDQMLQFARELSAGLKHLRVDLYVINGHIYFGELTFYHMSGCERFEPASWDHRLGGYIQLD